MIITESSLNKSELLKNESIFHVANGYLGVRGNFEEGYPEGYSSIRGTYINAFYDYGTIKYGERLYGFPQQQQKIINLVDVQTIRLLIGGESFSLFDGEVLSYSRRLDAQKGYMERSMVWRSPKGHAFKIDIRRMASFVLTELFTIDYSVTSLNYAGELRFASLQSGDVRNYFDPNDPRVASEAEKNLNVDSVRMQGGKSMITCSTSRSGLQLTSAVLHALSKPAKVSHLLSNMQVETQIDTTIMPNERIQLFKYCIFTDSRRHGDCDEQARKLLDEAGDVSAEQWYNRQSSYLDAFWERSRVIIEGDDKVQEGIDYNLYQLLQAAGRDSLSNIAAKGLSGEGYEGHYFWDTEIYMFPFFLLTERELALNLLNYRYAILDRARVHARTMGHKMGALYPWRTIIGDECSSYFPSGSAQYHINGDVAHSFILYYLVTGDLAYMAQKGAEVLLETARLWMDTGHYNENGQFCIDAVTGPDEYTCIVNNNYYTNACARENLSWAVKIYKKLKNAGLHETLAQKIGLSDTELLAFERAAAHMFLPYDERLGINPQDDTFLKKAVWEIGSIPEENFPLLLHYHPLYIYRYQICKQADTVLAHYLFDEGLDIEVVQRSFEYYERITTHDSSLSPCVFSIMAARLGDVDKAYSYFLETARLDLDDAHGNTKDGIHTANMGGTYLAIVAGFAGLRIREDGLHFNTVIPSFWLSYSFKLFYRDSGIGVRIDHANAVLTLLGGESVPMHVNGQAYVLVDELVIRRDKSGAAGGYI